MTKRMLASRDAGGAVAALVAGNENLQKDLEASMKDDKAFREYVDENYDSRADYWKLMNDGTLKQDKDWWLKDENGLFINEDGTHTAERKENTIGSEGIETGLLNILFGEKQNGGSIKNHGKKYDDFSPLEKTISNYIMSEAEISSHYDKASEIGMENTKWNNDKKTLDMDLVMGYAGNSIASQVFARYYDSTVDAKYADLHNLDVDIANTHAVTDAAGGRFGKLYKVKSEFYSSIGSFFESRDTKITGVYGDYIRDKAGNLLTNYKLDDGRIVSWKDFYQSYDNLHYGIDLIKNSGSDNLLLGLSGKIWKNGWDTSEGWTVHSNYGYKFENSFISTGVYGEYGHLAKQSNLQADIFYNANDKVGVFGGTGKKSTGDHLHYSIYTQNSYYSDSTMRILLGKNYKVGSMYNGSWRTVYNPTKLYERNK